MYFLLKIRSSRESVIPPIQENRKVKASSVLSIENAFFIFSNICVLLSPIFPRQYSRSKKRISIKGKSKEMSRECSANVNRYLQQNRLYPTIRKATAIITMRNDLGRISTQVMPMPIQKIIRPHNRFIPSSFTEKCL